MNNNLTISQEIIDSMIKDHKIRVAITRESHWYFFHLYFAHYVKFPTADFQREIIGLTENEQIKNLFIVAFRSSGKSTFITTSYPLWAILGKQQKKFVLILGQTRNQAKQHMMNLKRELETNELLRRDLGPFQEESDEWGSTSLVFSNYNARITAISIEQGVRGLRHNEHRPDLIIGDDIEDLASTKTREGRNKIYNWFMGEVIPAGDKNTRFIVVGNLLHEDSFLMRIKNSIEENRMSGLFKSFPIIDNGNIVWPGKYPTMDDIEEERKRTGDDHAWQREYMLKILPWVGQVIDPKWIHYYDNLPSFKKEDPDHLVYTGTRIGIDLAISERETADYTAVVPAMIFGYGSNAKIFILPKTINKRMSFPETVDMCKILDETYYESGLFPTFVIEDVAYQKALPQQLEYEGVHNVETTRPGGSDKRIRLNLTANLIKTGRVVFPKKGCEELINQIVHFGVEKHDDLADAFSNVVLHVSEKPPSWVGFC
jgi:predicted phage terminase large subunit-like protein